MQIRIRKAAVLILAAVMMIMMVSCGSAGGNTPAPDTRSQEAGTESTAEERTETSSFRV